MPAINETPCPACDEKALTLREVFEARQPGTHSLAGVQLKVTATSRLEWNCGTCGAHGPAATTGKEKPT